MVLMSLEERGREEIGMGMGMGSDQIRSEQISVPAPVLWLGDVPEEHNNRIIQHQ